MTAKVYVHIGPHKTGTTFLQQVLATNRQILRERGVLFPGYRYDVQRNAVLTLLDRAQPTATERPDAWDELAREVMAWRGQTAIISVENLDAARTRHVRQLVESFEGAEVHVIFTPRDLAKVIPGRWQTRMRNRAAQTWASYLAAVRDEVGVGGTLWRGQDPRLVFPRWEKRVPRERIHVVTVPPPSAAPDVLWGRFCSVVGLDPTLFSLDIPRTNESLGTAESELLRRVNASLDDRVARAGYVRWVQHFVAREVLEQRPNQTRFALPAGEHDWVRARAEEIVRFLADRKYEVTGDLDDLLPAPPSASAVAPDETSDREVLDAAVDVIAGLVVRLDRQRPFRTGVEVLCARGLRAVAESARRTMSSAQRLPARVRSRSRR